MQKLFKVKVKDSKYAWASSVDPESNSGFVINHEDAAIYKEMGLLRVATSGATAMLMAEPKLAPAINPETNASVGNRIIGFSGAVADRLTIIMAETRAKIQEKAMSIMSDEQIAAMNVF